LAPGRERCNRTPQCLPILGYKRQAADQPGLSQPFLKSNQRFILGACSALDMQRGRVQVEKELKPVISGGFQRVDGSHQYLFRKQ
jgi:hypothetical protein